MERALTNVRRWRALAEEADCFKPVLHASDRSMTSPRRPAAPASRVLAALPLLSLLLLAGAPAHAVPGGDIGTLHNGRWTCEFPGDAANRPRSAPEESFRILPDSSYTTTDRRHAGTYLLLGKVMTMTSGPFNGRSYEAQSASTVLQVDAQGRRTGLRCVRAGAPSGGYSDAPAAGNAGL